MLLFRSFRTVFKHKHLLLLHINQPRETLSVGLCGVCVCVCVLNVFQTTYQSVSRHESSAALTCSLTPAVYVNKDSATGNYSLFLSY